MSRLVHVLSAHRKAVSYVKFLSRNELASASTDSTLRIWDVTKNSLVRTYRGHVNEKNFTVTTLPVAVKQMKLLSITRQSLNQQHDISSAHQRWMKLIMRKVHTSQVQYVGKAMARQLWLPIAKEPSKPSRCPRE